MSLYLTLIETLLADGLTRVSPAFLARQAGFLECRQAPDGGFPGREGASDRYYSDFAARALTLCAPASPALTRLQPYLQAQPAPTELIPLFSHLNLARHLALPLDRVAFSQTLTHHLLPTGGAAHPGGEQFSAYRTFLALLCAELLETALPAQEALIAQALDLQTTGGGFADTPGGEAGANPTAAALAILMRLDALTPVCLERAAAYLGSLQMPDGGLRAHATAPLGDLLSTFTGLLSLALFDRLALLDLAAVARFLKRLAHPNGGFLAHTLDTERDCEYAFYGLGTLAVLQLVRG
jgi:geranylgeranyl transferase type-2 subunit beta